MSKISIVIPTYQRQSVLRQSLFYLNRQSVSPDVYEVIVVDDENSPDTEKSVSSLKTDYKLTYITHDSHGPAAARNAGVDAAKSDLIMFLGDDIWASRDLVFQHLYSHSRYNSVSSQRIIQGYIEWAREAQPSEFMFWLTCQLPNYEGSGLQFNFRVLREGDHWKENCDGWALTSNMSMTKEIFLAESGFNETFKTAAHEDIEFSTRLRMRQVPSYFNSQALAFHNHHLSFDDFISRQTKVGFASCILSGLHPEVAPSLISPDGLRDYSDEKLVYAIELAKEAHNLSNSNLKYERWGIALQYAVLKGILKYINEKKRGWLALPHVHTPELVMHVVSCASNIDKGDITMAQLDLSWASDKHQGNWALESLAGEVYLASGNLVEATSHAIRSLELGSDNWPKDILKRIKEYQ